MQHTNLSGVLRTGGNLIAWNMWFIEKDATGNETLVQTRRIVGRKITKVNANEGFVPRYMGRDQRDYTVE
jgi:hypothetical protein